MNDEKTTDELRQLLDDRGVEYETYHDAALTEVDAVFWQDRNGQPCSAIGNADDIPEGMLSVQCIISPDQAVEATLGRGTCRKVRAWEDDPRGGGGWVLVCSECDEFLANDGEDGEFDGPNFCPNCGRKVVK